MGNADTPAEYTNQNFVPALTQKAEKLREEFVRQTLQDLSSYYDALLEEYNKANPDRPASRINAEAFSVTINNGPGLGSEEVILTDEEIRQWEYAIQNEHYAWVVPTFESYLTPDPDEANPAIDNLGTIATMFGGPVAEAGDIGNRDMGLTGLQTVRDQMENHWEGSFQQTFIGNFIAPLENGLACQAAAARVAKELLEANKISKVAQRKAILDLLDKAIAALGDLGAGGKSAKSYAWSTLVGIAAGTLIAATGGMAAWVGAVIITTSTLAQGLEVGSDAEPVEIGGITAQDVAVAVQGALTKQNEKFVDDETKVADALTRLHQDVAAARNVVGQLGVNRPDLYGASFADIQRGLTPSD
ncbi:hypothetical protein EDC02_4512 [Micromonospora sp. Llam0]|uniref:hypothetical protein n=1 Tax=Micromonospora sp. Llam0 TaxID=2485143 RepID=UPI000F4AB665|nr:hypothetical protein [Micromonospora sp. Llam0]ROO62531.1 hypothetical protein EDC02_4512 [Micromonospora sp. Llam0]